MIVLRRFAVSVSSSSPHMVSLFSRCSSRAWPSLIRNERASYQSTSGSRWDVSFRNHLGVRNLSYFWQGQQQVDVRQMEVVDSDTWSVSSCLPHVSNGAQDAPQLRLLDLEEVGDGVAYNRVQIESDADIYDVEDLRIRGTLFYKVEKDSLEFDEYEFEFRGKKSKSLNIDKIGSKNREDLKCDVTRNGQTSLYAKEGHHESHEEISMKRKLKLESSVNTERLAKIIEDKYVVCDPSCVGKGQRTPSFNQLTGPYHEPFCLDIFVSKASVRACVVHRATSKVVIVAHSISKDMKFDLGSPKSVSAAAAVGKILAKRALEDDIHDVVYTPRKGDKLEGKLQVVFQSILDNGLNVKLKPKQRDPIKTIRRTHPIYLYN